MVWMIVSAILLLLSVGVFIFIRPRWIGCLPLIASIIVIFLASFTIVPTGFTGVLTTFGKVEDTTLEAGLRLKVPCQNIILMDNREQKQTFEFEAFSSDIQQTNVKGSVNFNINKQTSMKLYRDVGTEYVKVLMSPRLLENVKTVFSKYSAESLIASRDTLATEILSLMQRDLTPYGINVMSVSIEDIDFTDAFTNAIEAKTVAEQDKLRAEIQQEQATMEAEAQAERQRIQVEAEAEVAKIKADVEAYSIVAKAEAEANANEKINKSLTPELIEYNEVSRWNGELPDTYIGNEPGVIPIIDITSNLE